MSVGYAFTCKKALEPYKSCLLFVLRRFKVKRKEEGLCFVVAAGFYTMPNAVSKLRTIYAKTTAAAEARTLFVHAKSVMARMMVAPIRVIHTYVASATIVVINVKVSIPGAIMELYVAWDAAENIATYWAG